MRHRSRQSIDSPSLVTIGTLRKKRVSDNVVVQTIPVKQGTWPFAHQESTWDYIHKGPPYRTGGPFAAIKATVDIGTKGVGSHKGTPSGGFYWEYNGGFAKPYLSWEVAIANSYQDLVKADPFDSGLITSEAALGSEAYDRLRPSLSQADSSVFLYELKDTARMLSTSSAFFKGIYRRYAPRGEYTRSYVTSGEWLTNYYNSLRSQGVFRRSKKGADHYLNHQFGWAPFIKDILKINEVYQNQRKYVDQITKDNGAWMKRTRTISNVHTEHQDTQHSGYTTGLAWRPEFDSMTSDMLPGTYSRYSSEFRDISITTIWAAGSFTYYRPEFDKTLSDYESNWNEAMRLLTLYGARINPYILWKVTPWTWLLDWFVGIGTIIDRAVSWSMDGVVSRYMYLMKKTSMVRVHSASVNWNNGLQTFGWISNYETKQREVADNNFSFRLSGSLSARQLAIITALGLSRKR
jgi:hypothetical protein